MSHPTYTAQDWIPRDDMATLARCSIDTVTPRPPRSTSWRPASTTPAGCWSTSATSWHRQAPHRGPHRWAPPRPSPPRCSAPAPAVEALKIQVAELTGRLSLGRRHSSRRCASSSPSRTSSWAGRATRSASSSAGSASSEVPHERRHARSRDRSAPAAGPRHDRRSRRRPARAGRPPGPRWSGSAPASHCCSPTPTSTWWTWSTPPPTSTTGCCPTRSTPTSTGWPRCWWSSCAPGTGCSGTERETGSKSVISVHRRYLVPFLVELAATRPAGRRGVAALTIRHLETLPRMLAGDLPLPAATVAGDRLGRRGVGCIFLALPDAAAVTVGGRAALDRAVADGPVPVHADARTGEPIVRAADLRGAGLLLESATPHGLAKSTATNVLRDLRAGRRAGPRPRRRRPRPVHAHRDRTAARQPAPAAQARRRVRVPDPDRRQRRAPARHRAGGALDRPGHRGADLRGVRALPQRLLPRRARPALAGDQQAGRQVQPGPQPGDRTLRTAGQQAPHQDRGGGADHPDPAAARGSAGRADPDLPHRRRDRAGELVGSADPGRPVRGHQRPVHLPHLAEAGAERHERHASTRTTFGPR